MRFWQEGQSLLYKHGYETVMITPWGKNALRVRATKYPRFTENDWALEEQVLAAGNVEIVTGAGEAKVTNGRLCIKVDASGIMTFYRDGKKILKEYHRDYDQPSCRESRCLKIRGREYKAIVGGDYALKVRFESNDKEKIYGMGQYQQSYLDLKGCTLELAHKKIGLISGPLDSYILKARYHAYFNALEKYGLEISEDYIGLGYYVSESTRKYIPKLLEQGVTAILFSHDVRAISAIAEFDDRDIRIPDDISIVGFDDLPMTAYTTPPLTTVRQDRIALGQCGFYALSCLLNHVTIGSILLRAPLIIRGSTGPAPRQE